MRRIQASEKYMASRSSEKSLPFYFQTGLGHNFNMNSKVWKISIQYNNNIMVPYGGHSKLTRGHLILI